MKDFISERPIKKRYFTHGEIAKMLDEPKWMINFWANQFGFKREGRLYDYCWHYDREIVAKFHEIKDLIRNQEWTIKRLKIKFGIK